jgi:3-phenylpropionate/trans-cinnamate dioxygenase ferredoxin reductase subunit
VADRNVDVLLIGGGIASASAAAELRARGFEGSILLATREQDPPYHRPPVTKDYLQGRVVREQTHVQPDEWWAANGVELMLRAPVTVLYPERRTAKVGREEIGFGQALLATGAMVRRLQIDGAQLDGIHYLRALGNSEALGREANGAEHITIIGGSYIATEVAASLTSMRRRCTVVMQEQLPLERTFGERVGRLVAGELESRGVELLGGEDVVRFEGAERVEAVVTASGRRIATDLVVVGVGATADASLAKRAGLTVGETGGVLCDAALRTSARAVFAAGDVCEFDSVLHGRSVRIEHEEVAAAQGRLAARNMITGGDEPFRDVPYFWSELADWLTLEYVGLGGAWDHAELDPYYDERRFAVRYERDGRLVGVCSIGGAVDLDAAREELAATALAAAPAQRRAA